MFFAHNTALGPPYHVLIDTNFINFSIKVRGMCHDPTLGRSLGWNALLLL